ncbi:Zinc finger, PMZ-type, partial [Melia azedarach]
AAQAIIDKQLELSRPMTVEPVSRNEFEVKHRGTVEVVHLQEKTCSCRRFDLSQLPCAHALAACRHICLSHNSLCAHYYTTNTWMNAYAESIHPVGNDVDWLIPSEVREIIVHPPRQRPPVGRRRKQRIPSIGEDVMRRMCSRCHQRGHNRATCKNPIP